MLEGPKNLVVDEATPLPPLPHATAVRFDDGHIIFDLSNRGSLAFPLDEFPRLAAASPEERNKWRLVWNGEAVRWDGLDEDISLCVLPSGEC